jgi:hypothetical protein
LSKFIRQRIGKATEAQAGAEKDGIGKVLLVA